ncbi:11345_t:CDS:2 [Scutellospora calospora]|uniref:11345_t:CDS:1 n=1 Tax=Scutellospora calospora TaxID=85575 RepID=A0ACA9JX85_9GLOM|nr:11345_t:CDS:2 [Scutellospora calospora]
MNDNKKVLDEEIARIKKLLKEQEEEINIEKQKYYQLLELFDNVKKNVVDAIKEHLSKTLNETLKNLNDDIKKLIIDIKNIDEIVKTKTYYPDNIDLNNKIKEKILEALKDPDLDQDEKNDLLNYGIFNADKWKEENFFKYFTDLDTSITQNTFKN